MPPMVLHLGLTALSTLVFSALPDGGQAAGTTSSATESVPVISTREQTIAGTPPHSPGTADHAIHELRNWRASSSESGSTGLLHLSTAKLGPVGLFRLSGLGQLAVRTMGGFTTSWVADDHLETFLGYGVSSGRRSDLQFGTKLITAFAQRWYIGAEAAGSGLINADRSSIWGFRPRLLATLDSREDLRLIPMLFHANLGLAIQKKGGEVAASHPFSASASDYQRVLAGVGVEIPLPWVTPFAEYALAYPLGAGNLISVDGLPLRTLAAVPHVMTLGGRVTPLRDLTLTLAGDFGFTRTVALGLPPAPRFNFFFGASFNTNFLERADVRIVETVREQPTGDQSALAMNGQITGVVLDSASHKPIPAAIVNVSGSELPPVATDPESGRFLSQALRSGTYQLAVHHEHYRSGTLEAKVDPGRLVHLEVMLDRLAPQATFSVAAGSKGRPVAAEVSFDGETQRKLTLSPTGNARLTLPAGRYEVIVTAKGFLAQTREVQVSPGAEMSVSFELSSEPVQKRVSIKKDKIEISQQVHFGMGKANILLDSYGMLNEVVDAIIRNNIRRVRIEGHTDSQGNKQFNQSLSEQRARSVADYLLRAGIDRGRIESVGYGDSKPIAPNLNPRGREMNRRVEFFIVESSSNSTSILYRDQ